MDMDINKLYKVADEISELTDGLAVSYSSNRYLEFNNLNASKGLGLQKLTEILNVDPSETMAIGDHVNDLSMLKQAALAVGVRNCNPGILKHCDVILEATNNEDPITEIFNRYYK
jgi:hypothetical protein